MPRDASHWLPDWLPNSSALAAAIVSSVFLLWFGESGAMLSDMAARIADGINAALLSTCRRRAESSTSTLQACGQRQERDFRRSVGRATMQASPP